MPTLVAGVDCSTQTTTVLLVDVVSGRVVARGRAPHRVDGTGGRRESDPERWWTALHRAFLETGRAEEVAAIAIAAQQHALVVLDGEGQPLRPAPLWNDTTSAGDAHRLVAELGVATWARRVGSVPTSAFTVAKWASLRRSEAKSLPAVEAVRLPHHFLTERLCGRAVTDRGDVSGTGWWSPADDDYAADVLGHRLVGLDRGLLPEVQSGGKLAATAGEGRGPGLWACRARRSLRQAPGTTWLPPPVLGWRPARQ